MKHCIPARKKLTALALTQPKETVQMTNHTRIIILDRMFNVKITSAIECAELTETLKTFQLN